jgi:ubiquinol-cytochrome c reductase cytochrome c subunit
MAAIILAAALETAAPPSPVPNAGREAYLERCATCHGSDLRGGPNAPSLRGVGAADVDFWLGTGRMPAAVPWLEVDHRELQMPESTIAALVAYVTSVSPGGVPIPLIASDGDAAHGEALFRENCMHCHGVDAGGAAIGYGEWAPALHRATVTQVAEAIRVGPAEMPRFGERQLDQRDLDDIAAFLSVARARPDFTGLPLSSSGPVPEGLLGWLAAGLLAFAAYAFSPPGKEPKP